MQTRVLLLWLLCLPLWAAEYNPRVQQHINVLQGIASDPLLIHTLENSNQECQSLIGILAIEKSWTDLSPQERHIMVSDNQLGHKFHDIINSPDTDFVEFILSSEQGETVAAWPAPSDYWQGDEVKFTATVARRAPVVEQIDWDESSGTIALHVSVPVFGKNGLVIGVLTSGIEIDTSHLPSLHVQ
jgi:hypothetical protein